MSKKTLFVVAGIMILALLLGILFWYFFIYQKTMFETNADDNSFYEEEEIKYGNIVPMGRSAPGKVRTLSQKIEGPLSKENDRVYLFEFLGDDSEKIIYEVDTSDPENKAGRLKIKAKLNEQSFYPLNSLYPLFRQEKNEPLTNKEATTNITSKLKSHSLKEKGRAAYVDLYFEDEIKTKNVSQKRERTVSLKIIGKTLKIKQRARSEGELMVEASYNYAGADLGEIKETQTLRRFSLPYMTLVPIFLVNNKIFMSAFIDPTRSHGTKITESKDKASFLGTLYEPNASGQISSFKEVAYLTLSGKVEETFLDPRNPTSEYRADLTKRTILSGWKMGDFLKGVNDQGLSLPIKIADESFNNLNFNNDRVYLKILKEFGIEDLLIIQHTWRNGPVANVAPKHLPIPDKYGGATEYKKLIQQAKDLGYLIIQHEIWPYVNTHYLDKNSPDYNAAYEDLLVKNSQNEFKIKKGIFAREEDEFVVSPDKYINLAQEEVSKFKEMGIQGSFLDTISAWFPDKIGEINYSQKDNAAKNLEETIKANKQFFNYLKNNYLGPLFGEGGKKAERFDSYYAGFIDGVEREHDYAKDGYVVPDFEQKIIKPKMVGVGMGWRDRWLCLNSTDPECEIDFDNFNFDQFRAQTISFGHASLLPASHNLKGNDKNLQKILKQTVKEYYLMKELQNQYLSSKIKKIDYHLFNGLVGNLSETYIKEPNYNFQSSRLKISYQNGLVIYINNDQKNNWLIEVKNKKYTLLPNGWLAYNENLKGWQSKENFLAFSNILEKNYDYFSSENYLYLESREAKVTYGNESIEGINVTTKDGKKIICNQEPKCSLLSQ